MKAVEWHVRFNVSSTIKEGFRVAEITVSADFEDGNEPTYDQFKQKTNEIYNVADEFCDSLNQERRQRAALTK